MDLKPKKRTSLYQYNEALFAETGHFSKTEYNGQMGLSRSKRDLW